MEIVIKVIPYKEQRYPTCGDWWRDENNNIQIRVNDMGDIRKESMVAIHELVEMLLCEQRDITEKDVSDFDKQYEANRKEGDDSEPGDNINAPYKKEHRFSENIERQICHEFGYDWNEYNESVLNSCE